MGDEVRPVDLPPRGITRELEAMSDWELERGLASSTGFDQDRRVVDNRILRATVSSGPSVIAEPCDGKRRPAGLAHNLADARSGLANRAYVSGDGTAARSRTPSAAHTRMNNGNHVCAA
jgi:hypothetical protein